MRTASSLVGVAKATGRAALFAYRLFEFDSGLSDVEPRDPTLPILDEDIEATQI